MSWKVKIERIVDPPYPTDSKVLHATFSRDDGSGAFTREFKLAAGNFKSAQDVSAFLADRVADLSAMDGIAADLTPLVGQDITTGSGLPPRADTVSNFQCRAMLMRAGLFDTIDAAIHAEGGAALAAWEYSATIHRQSPLVVEMAKMLGLGDEQVGQMFEEASRIVI